MTRDCLARVGYLVAFLTPGWRASKPYTGAAIPTRPPIYLTQSSRLHLTDRPVWAHLITASVITTHYLHWQPHQTPHIRHHTTTYHHITQSRSISSEPSSTLPLPPRTDTPPRTAPPLTCDLHRVRTALDVLVGELDGHLVLAGRGSQVRHGHCAVLVVMTTDLRLAGALHGQRQTAWGRDRGGAGAGSQGLRRYIHLWAQRCGKGSGAGAVTWQLEVICY